MADSERRVRVRRWANGSGIVKHPSKDSPQMLSLRKGVPPSCNEQTCQRAGPEVSSLIHPLMPYLSTVM